MADWQAKLSLHGWRIERSSGKTKAMAEVTVSYPDMLASYKVGSFGSAGTSPQTISATALHELLHVLLYELVNQRLLGLDGDLLISAEHRVVNALEKLLMGTQR